MTHSHLKDKAVGSVAGGLREGMDMLCKCGAEITNVPEHLRGLASWMCQKCTNTAPKAAALPFETETRRMFPKKQRKEAA